MTQFSNDSAISPATAFDAMREFLEAYWDQGGRTSNDLAILLSSLNRDETTQSMPLDPAMWDDWLDAVNKVRSRSSGRSVPTKTT